MVFLRGFAPTLSLVLSLVPPVNDDRALHVRQPGYVDKYDFDTSYSFAQTLYGAQSFKSDPVLDLATQSVNADFLSTLFRCGGEDLATSLGPTPAPSSTLASDYASRHPEYTPYDNIGQAFATPACFSSPPVIELLELPESVDEHCAHGNYTSITVSDDAGMGIPAGVADVEKAYAAHVEQPMAFTDATLSDATPSDTTPSDATLSTPTLAADIVAHAGNATEDADAELVFEAANVDPSFVITGADSEFAPPLQVQSLASGVRVIINEFSAIGVHLVTIALTTFKLAIVIEERIYYRFGSIAYYVYDAAVVRHVSSLATMTYETMLASLCIIAAIAVLMYGALLYQKDFLEDISLFRAEMVTNASSRIMTSRESEGEIETSYSDSDPSPNADHDNLSEDEKPGATMAPVDNNSYRCVMFTDSYARVRLSECKDMVVMRNPGLKADVPATPSIPTLAADIVAHAGNDTEDADAELVFKAANVEPSIEITGADSKFAPSMQSQSPSPELRKIIEGFAVIGVFLKAILVSFGVIASKFTLMLKMWIVSTFSSLFQYVALIYKIIRCVLIMRSSKGEIYALFCFVLGTSNFRSLVEDIAVYLGSRKTEETAEVSEIKISDMEKEDDVPIMVNKDSIDDGILRPVANEITVDDAILLTSLPTSASSDEDANITEMSLSSNVVSAPEAPADDAAVAVVSEVVFAYEKADQKEAEMGLSTGYDVEVEGSELIDAVDGESLLSFGSSATLCDDALSVMVDLAPGLSIEDGAHAVDSQPDGTLQPMDIFESADNLKNSDIEDEDAELVNIDNLLGETSSTVLSDDALSAAGDSSSGSSIEEGTHAADSELGTSELMVILESTEPLEVSNEIGPMESVIPDSDDSEVSATSLESSVNEEGKVVDLEDASTLPDFPSPENAIVMDSALCDADSSTSTSDTCVDSFSSPENDAGTLPSEPSSTLVPAEMQSTPSPSTADEVPEVANTRGREKASCLGEETCQPARRRRTCSETCSGATRRDIQGHAFLG
ncbi:hypothetical protein DFH11DRAFT_255409 [Phellopilus nigrolimitatus]|nr:hypothetical protein DFH11DRAFT_255409 [Phellopilus nigrolimitatus]